MTSPRAAFIGGLKNIAPLLIGAAPFGIIYGVIAVGVGIPVVVAQAISLIVFAGSAQFIAAQLIGAGASGLVIVLTTFIVNLRHALYSASWRRTCGTCLEHGSGSFPICLRMRPMRWRSRITAITPANQPALVLPRRRDRAVGHLAG